MLGNRQVVHIRSESDILAARQRGRELGADLGFAKTDLTLLATAISELARNIVVYAGGGDIILAIVEDGNKRGISVTARDQGPGIPDLERAMQDGYSTGKSLGLGLPGTKRLSDEFEISSEVGEGTTVSFKKWKR